MSLRRHKTRIKKLEERVESLGINKRSPIPKDPEIDTFSFSQRDNIRKFFEALETAVKKSIDSAKDQGLINTKEEEEAYWKSLYKKWDPFEKLNLERKNNEKS